MPTSRTNHSAKTIPPSPGTSGVSPWLHLSSLQRLQATRQRRARRVRWAKLLVVGGVGLWLVQALAPSILARAPKSAELNAEADRVARLALIEESNPFAPLVVAAKEVTVEHELNGDERLYRISVRLKLPRALYVPAFSNGTRGYDGLRLALEDARYEVSMSGGHDFEGLGPIPEPLPRQLVQRSHFAGEEITVTSSVIAKRSGFQWRFSSPFPSVLRTDRKLIGRADLDDSMLVFDEIRPDPALVKRLEDVREFLLKYRTMRKLTSGEIEQDF